MCRGNRHVPLLLMIGACSIIVCCAKAPIDPLSLSLIIGHIIPVWSTLYVLGLDIFSIRTLKTLVHIDVSSPISRIMPFSIISRH